MEFRIAKTEFLRGLRLAQGIADRKSTMPMLANVLLRTQGKNQLLVAATDLNVSLTAELKSAVVCRASRRPRCWPGAAPSAAGRCCSKA
jgi:DNA polymerase-3 subunit beta